MAKPDRILSKQALPLVCKVGNVAALGFAVPGPKLEQAVRSLPGKQKEAPVVKSRTSDVWRLTSDQGAHVDGHDEAPCPRRSCRAGW